MRWSNRIPASVGTAVRLRSGRRPGPASPRAGAYGLSSGVAARSVRPCAFRQRCKTHATLCKPPQRGRDLAPGGFSGVQLAPQSDRPSTVSSEAKKYRPMPGLVSSLQQAVDRSSSGQIASRHSDVGLPGRAHRVIHDLCGPLGSHGRRGGRRSGKACAHA